MDKTEKNGGGKSIIVGTVLIFVFLAPLFSDEPIFVEGSGGEVIGFNSVRVSLLIGGLYFLYFGFKKDKSTK